MRKVMIILASAIALACVGACNNTTTSPAVVCGPDNVATTNLDVVAVTDYEAGWYWASLDAISVNVFTVAAATVNTVSDPLDGGFVEAGAALLDGAVASAASASVANVVAGAVGNYFSPAGCATATANGNVVTFQLNSCSGPLDLASNTGTFTATFNVVDSMIQVQLAGNNIATNGATINLSTSGTLTFANGQRTLQATSNSSGTGPFGNSVAHSGTFTVVWPTGVGCATINGTMSGTSSANFGGTTTQITNFVSCANKCPQSGTTTSSFNGGTATLAFNGSNNAQCTASNGTSASIPLTCP